MAGGGGGESAAPQPEPEKKKEQMSIDDYRAMIAEKLAREAAEEAAKLAECGNLFRRGEKAYARGDYAGALALFEQARELVAGKSELGGQVQLWQAISLESLGRHKECIVLLKELEDKHPDEDLRKQAAEVRFIYEAPRLRLSEEDFVKVPVVTDLEPAGTKKTWRDVKKWTPDPKAQKEPTLEELFGEIRPPRWASNPYVWVAGSVLVTALNLYLVRFP